MKGYLIVEDNPDDRYFMERAVMRAGIGAPVTFASSGQEAKNYLQSAREKCEPATDRILDAVLLDLKLPDMSGFAVLKWIRSDAAFAKTAVVVLSSSTQQSDFEEAYKLGANWYAVKPGNADKLIDLVAQIDECARTMKFPDCDFSGF
jgi:CheY-like chemotaxis protein